MSIIYLQKQRCEVETIKSGNVGVGAKNFIKTLYPYWIYVCGNIQEIPLLLEIVDYCGCVHIKYIYLFNFINGPVDHKTKSIHS